MSRTYKDRDDVDTHAGRKPAPVPSRQMHGGFQRPDPLPPKKSIAQQIGELILLNSTPTPAPAPPQQTPGADALTSES